MPRERLRTKEKTLLHGEETSPRVVSPAFVALSKLLRASSFCLGDMPAAQRGWLQANLSVESGRLDPSSPFYIGNVPPADRPAVGLGSQAGLLGPHSFGFLNNLGEVAALAAPLRERPKQGRVAVVVPTRDALPETMPLLCRQDWGISWLISVGEGDPADTLRFLSMDPATTAVLVAVGPGMHAQTLAPVCGQKNMVFLDFSDGDAKARALNHAVARRHRIPVLGDLEQWLAYGSLLSAPRPPTAETPVRVAVLGSGGDWVAREAKKAGLESPLRFDADQVAALQSQVHQAAVQGEQWVICGDAEVQGALVAAGTRDAVWVDAEQPERVRALLQVLTQLPSGDPDVVLQAEGNSEAVRAIGEGLPPVVRLGKRSSSADSAEVLSDHDTKRLLHAYGVRVSRQAPANTATAALRVATSLSFPLMLVDPAEGTEWVCPSVPELKRQAASLLVKRPYLLVREFFPATPRWSVQIVDVAGVGPVLYLSGRAMLLPLLRTELDAFLRQQPDLQPGWVKPLAELLTRVASCVLHENLRLEAVLHASSQPAVVSAQGTWHRKKTGVAI